MGTVFWISLSLKAGAVWMVLDSAGCRVLRSSRGDAVVSVRLPVVGVMPPGEGTGPTTDGDCRCTPRAPTRGKLDSHRQPPNTRPSCCVAQLALNTLFQWGNHLRHEKANPHSGAKRFQDRSGLLLGSESKNWPQGSRASSFDARPGVMMLHEGGSANVFKIPVGRGPCIGGASGRRERPN